MNGLHFLQAVLGQSGTGKQLGQALQDPENKGFLQALVESGAFGDTDIDPETLQAMLRGDIPMDLPQRGEDLPPMGASLPPGQQLEGDAELRDEELPLEDPLVMLAALGLQPGADEARGMSQRDAELRQSAQGEQLSARLALLDQLELRRQGSQLQGPDKLAARSFSETAGLQQFQALMPAAGADARPTAVPTFTVGTPMDQSGWGQALGERVLLLAGQGIKEARIQLNPRELGPVDVAITMREEKTTVVFQAQHAVTREALEAELPRLRNMLQEQGFQQLDVNVGRDGSREMAERDSGRAGRGDTGDGEQDDAALDGERRETGLVSTRLLDHYV